MKIKDSYELRKIGEHYVVARRGEKQGIVFALNETGALLWEGILEGLSKDELHKKLCQEYEAEQEEEQMILADVEEFLEQLDKMGVLVND
ncbi:MAG: PqqD family protein [Lachnospiraceae bacterium]|nr:PqqD family protein [Lachnospiraceae bacterium]